MRAIGSDELSKSFLDSLLTHPGVGFGLVSRDGVYLRVSPVLAALNGVPVEEHIGRTVREVLPELADEVERLIAHVVRTGEPLDIEIVGETPAFPDEVRSFSARYIPVRDDDGDVAGIAALITDVTDHRRVERQLRTLFEAAPGAILGVGADGGIIHVNRAAEELFGYPAEELVGRCVDVLVPEEARGRHEHHRADFAEHPETRPMGRNRALRGRRRDGSVFPVEISLGPAGDGTVTVFIGDITERQRLVAELAHQALHDPLTGLPNRTLLADRLEHALLGAARHGGSVALLLIDLDRFKVVNDSLGHEAGDELLLAIAPRLREATRDSDTVARLGGDEFVVVCELVEGEREAILLAERIATCWTRPFSVGGRELYVTASVGIALSGERADAASLLREADAAMYRAKEERRGGHAVFDDQMRGRAMGLLRLEGALRRAVRDGELSLAYQPIVELVTGKPVAVEALLRWNDPERGPVPPAEFVGLAEEIGLIEEIGRWVLETAVAQVARWQAETPGRPLGVSVNVSGQQIASRAFVDDVRRVLRHSGLAPGTLAIEITESVLLRESSAPQVLADLRALGVGVMLDDFGVGYSALGYLRQLAIDGIKIDRAFVADLLTGQQGEAIVGALVTMAHALGLGVVAEGVETQRQATLLAELGCEQAQGFLFARPAPAEAVAQALRAG